MSGPHPTASGAHPRLKDVQLPQPASPASDAPIATWPGARGWHRYENDTGEYAISSPCQRIRSAREPGNSWTTTALYRDRFQLPTWRADFDPNTPAELQHAFHRALVEQYEQLRARDDDQLTALTTPGTTALVYLPLLSAGWEHTVHSQGVQVFVSQTQGTLLRHHFSPSRRATTPVWHVNSWGGHWEARFNGTIPACLVAAFSTALVAPQARMHGPEPLSERALDARNERPAPGERTAEVTESGFPAPAATVFASPPSHSPARRGR
ncbi:DUF317 domain-containing protein [Streptomyces sp. NPDC050085]|uniref:DUF317 domain-containing protein n=1 Tax=Streptomyces sp. NPDC050085 TaxID=3365600 RepID=UPI0037B4A1BD